MMSIRTAKNLIATLACLVLLTSLSSVVLASGTTPNGLTLKGDQPGTVFRSLTVEGENRVRVHFERPELLIDIDPRQAPGLDLDDAMDILNRTLPDMVKPFLETSASVASGVVPRPWISVFNTGPVARFTPQLAGVDFWKLQVVDSRGETAMVFAGSGNPPPVIAWDGLRLDGTPASPGYTYSYVLEARDPAGNLRRFVGDGFTLAPYRRDTPVGPDFLVSGEQWQQSEYLQAGPSALLLEAGSWFNQRCRATQPVRVVATCRTAPAAAELAAKVSHSLQALIGGSPRRVIVETRVEAGAPVAGTLRLTAVTRAAE